MNILLSLKYSYCIHVHQYCGQTQPANSHDQQWRSIRSCEEPSRCYASSKCDIVFHSSFTGKHYSLHLNHNVFSGWSSLRISLRQSSLMDVHCAVSTELLRLVLVICFHWYWDELYLIGDACIERNVLGYPIHSNVSWKYRLQTPLIRVI